MLIGRDAEALGALPSFKRKDREVVALGNTNFLSPAGYISGTAAAIWWDPSGLNISRLSGSHGSSLSYRQWGIHHERYVDEYAADVADLSPRTCVKLGESGFWCRTIPTRDFPLAGTQATTRQRRERNTLRPLTGQQQSELQRRFSCARDWLSAEHLLLEECDDSAHLGACTNLVALVGTCLPILDWPPEGWLPPPEVLTVSQGARLSRFTKKARPNTTECWQGVREVVSEATQETLLRIEDVLRRILQERWLPPEYIDAAARIIADAVPVDWSRPATGERRGSEREPVSPPYTDQVQHLRFPGEARPRQRVTGG